MRAASLCPGVWVTSQDYRISKPPFRPRREAVGAKPMCLTLNHTRYCILMNLNKQKPSNNARFDARPAVVLTLQILLTFAHDERAHIPNLAGPGKGNCKRR